LTVSDVDSFPGELDTLRADNMRLRRLLQLSEEQARAAATDQATLTGTPASPVTMRSSSADKVRFFFELDPRQTGPSQADRSVAEYRGSDGSRRFA
jgi:hypothetical protein